MKTILPFGLAVIIACFSACVQKGYTSKNYFNCSAENSNQVNNDTTRIVQLLLERALVERPDIPDYHLITDKKNIYVSDELFMRTIYGDTSGIHKHKIIASVPDKIKNVHFCVKSKETLNLIAANTEPFVYVRLGDFRITGDSATVAILTTWARPAGSNTISLSGGGYLAEFARENGKWVFRRIIENWIS
jgi:hypothetical protein